MKGKRGGDLGGGGTGYPNFETAQYFLKSMRNGEQVSSNSRIKLGDVTTLSNSEISKAAKQCRSYAKNRCAIVTGTLLCLNSLLSQTAETHTQKQT
ncbi:hypothetical protein RRG08_008455 [Elysia crispata]|uniref:Uncharacterized protein n=1 Tax=Elysia crispata TaxID=231223 RepID=A0AAE1E9L3_9GAST|nr:hypothetical protein RRG08_008455 [Elysia crispata]